MSGKRIGLAVGFAVLAIGMVSTASAKEHKYVGVAKCRSCHKKELMGDQYGEWQKGPHAKAFETLKGDKAVELAKKKGITTPPSETPECLECHVTAYGVEKARIRYPVKPGDGVQCESCHGPGSDYRKKTVMSDEKKAQAAGLWLAGKDHEICTTCHNDKSPSWDPKKFKLANGTTAGFDYEQAAKKIAHPIPKDVKGHYLEIVEKRKREGGGGADEDEEED